MSFEDTQIEFHLQVRGMACDGCAEAVANAAQSVSGVRSAFVDLGSGRVTVKGLATVDERQVVQAIRAAGYQAA